jgi:Zn-dependent protease
MIPFPPLDGGKVAMSLLPRNLAILLSKLEAYGFYIVIALSMTGILGTVIRPIIIFLAQIFLWYV